MQTRITESAEAEGEGENEGESEGPSEPDPLDQTVGAVFLFLDEPKEKIDSLKKKKSLKKIANRGFKGCPAVEKCSKGPFRSSRDRFIGEVIQ